MSWDAARIQHNASIVYHHFCSKDADRVYVDTKGDLQFDDRIWLFRVCTSLGNSTRQQVTSVALQMLEEMAQALKSGQLPVDRLIDEHASLGGKGQLSDLTTPLMSAPKRCTREEFTTKIQSINWGDSAIRMQMLIIRILQVKAATTLKAPYGTQ